MKRIIALLLIVWFSLSFIGYNNTFAETQEIISPHLKEFYYFLEIIEKPFYRDWLYYQFLEVSEEEIVSGTIEFKDTDIVIVQNYHTYLVSGHPNIRITTSDCCDNHNTWNDTNILLSLFHWKEEEIHEILNILSEKYKYTGFLTWEINDTYDLYLSKDTLLNADCLKFILYNSLGS